METALSHFTVMGHWSIWGCNARKVLTSDLVRDRIWGRMHCLALLAPCPVTALAWKVCPLMCCCCAGIVELEPSMLWNPQVVAGIGAVTDPTKLHKDMHTYLAGTHMPATQLICSK